MSPSARQGFTLVEIMITVVIIGLLATMAIPTFNRMRVVSQDNAVYNNARQLAAASDQYMLEHGVSSVLYTDLVGPDRHIKTIQLAASEIYPEIYTSGPIVVTHVGGRRSITFDR